AAGAVAGAALESAALDEGVDNLDELAAFLRWQALDLLQTPLQSTVAWAAGAFGRRRLQAQQLIGAELQGLRERGQQRRRRMLTLAFVVGDHPARDADFIGELLLGVAGGLAQRGEALAESSGCSVLLFGHLA